jgi:imidazolonepropionase-like amidohydrolase
MVATALGLLWPASAASPRPAQAPTTAFVGVTVIPMDSDRTLADQTVVIRDGRIASIGPAARVQVPAEAIRIDGRGKYLLPGLTDMHVHFRLDAAENAAQLRLYLANGVTTVLNLRGTSEHLDLRRRVASGEVLGPTIFTSGPFVNEPEVKTPEDVERAVVEQKRAGYDVIKIHGSLSRAAYQRLFEVARREKIKVVGHAPRNLPFMVVPAEHQDALAHAEEVVYTWFDFRFDHPQDPDTLGPRITYVAKELARANVAMIPTLVAFQTIRRQVDDICGVLARPEMRYVPSSLAKNWIPQSNGYVKRFSKSDVQTFDAMYRLQEALVKALVTEGARIMTGTDATIPSVVPGTSLHEELERLVGAGLTPYQALRASTAVPAEFLGSGAEFGTVQAGRRADLLLLDANPLERIQNTTRINGVMVRGRWLPGATLIASLDSLAASYRRAPNATAASAPAIPGPPLKVTPGRGTATAFVDVTVIPMDRARSLANQTVVVRDGKIAAMGPAGSTRVPPDATRIDAKGRYLLPGLHEMHAHLAESDEENRASLDLYLANGITTILSLQGTPTHLTLRGRVASGEIRGPTILTTGPYVNEPFMTTPDEVERAVVAQKRAGYDFIKMHGDLTREAYHRLFEVARREGIRVMGHAPRNLPFEVMGEERQEMVVHAEEYLYVHFNDPMKNPADLAERTARIPDMAASVARAGTWLTPTLTVFRGIPEQIDGICAVMARPEMKYVPAAIARRWVPSNNPYLNRFGAEDSERFWNQYRYLERVVKGFHDAGVRLLAGTDPPVPSVIAGFALHLELANLVAAGLTPYEALEAATSNAADYLHRLDQTGTVAVNKRADLLLLDADPLTDITNTRRRAGVMLGGRWYAQSELSQALDARANR